MSEQIHYTSSCKTMWISNNPNNPTDTDNSNYPKQLLIKLYITTGGHYNIQHQEKHILMEGLFLGKTDTTRPQTASTTYLWPSLLQWQLRFNGGRKTSQKIQPAKATTPKTFPVHFNLCQSEKRRHFANKKFEDKAHIITILNLLQKNI